MVLPYHGGEKGKHVIKDLRKQMNNMIPEVNTRIIFNGTHLSSRFNIKDRIPKVHKHNTVYLAKCPGCGEKYVGETGRRLQERIRR